MKDWLLAFRPALPRRLLNGHARHFCSYQDPGHSSRMRSDPRKANRRANTSLPPKRDWSKQSKRVWLVSRYAKQRSSMAEALGEQLQRPVKRIDLSQLVSQDMEQTQENLARVFANAEGKDWLLFFDEADALFGERTDGTNAHDRYDSEQVSSFLNQIEQSTSPVVVAARRQHSLDSAFVRRLRMSVVTPLPLPKVRTKRQVAGARSN